MSVAAAAHAGREDVDFERLQRAVRLRNGGRADIAVRFDIRYVGERDAADRRVAGELDIDVLESLAAFLAGGRSLEVTTR
jgi:hypothetical protein